MMSRSKLCLAMIYFLLAAAGMRASAQISLSGAVTLAVLNSPRVKVARADVDKARAGLSETRDVYLPSLTAGAGLGQAYGYSPQPPTLFTFNAGSLIYNASQGHLIKSARDGLLAANLTLEDVREAVAEDAALAFVALEHDQQRDADFALEAGYASRLVQITQDRLDAGLDRREDLTNAKLAAAQLRVRILRAGDDTANDLSHLSALTGIPADKLQIVGGFPANPLPPATPDSLAMGSLSPAVASAFENARAKQQLAYGDTHFLYRPQLSLVIQYNRYATFTNAFATLQNLEKADNSMLGANEEVFGVQVIFPLFDKLRQARGRESLADAAHALHEAENARVNALDGASRLTRSIEEFRADFDVATLQQEKAEEDLELLRMQLQSSTSTGPVTTPKDEQNSLLAERDRHIDVLDRTFDLRRAEINLLRQTGELEEWLNHSPMLPTLNASPSNIPPAQSPP